MLETIDDKPTDQVCSVSGSGLYTDLTEHVMTDVDEVGPKLLDQYHLPEQDEDVLRHIDRISQKSLKDIN